VPECGLDHPPDVELVRLAGRQVPPGDLRIMVHEFGNGRARLRLADRLGLLEQSAELDLRRPFGLAGGRSRISRPVSGSVPQGVRDSNPEPMA
jgi:hypothetical protein